VHKSPWTTSEGIHQNNIKHAIISLPVLIE
jgi:hypothetical protein